MNPSTPTTPSTVDLSAASIRGGRVFVATMLAMIGYSVSAGMSGISSVPINLNDPKKTAIAIAVSFVVGFLAALAKAIRDKYSDANGNGKVNYLPL